MPKQVLDITTGKTVTSYDTEEAINIAARLMASSDIELGIFSLGYICGMAVANPERFGKAPKDDSVDPSTAFAVLAQAVVIVKEDFDRSKRICVMNEVQKGPAFLDSKHAMVDKMLGAGAEMNDSISKYLKKKIDERVDAYEKVMVDGLKGKIDAEKSSSEDNG